MGTFIFYFLLFYFIAYPITVLLHEIGHAFGLILSTKDGIVRIYLGSGYWDDSNKENFSLGRVHFHIRWGFSGFCTYESNEKLTRLQTVIFLICGPLISFVLSLTFTLFLFIYHPQGNLNRLMNGMAIMNFFQFLGTIIPIIYPKWMKTYGGYPSDGYKILETTFDKK